MELDPFILSRIQFAANISFHILFPSISIGLCWLLVYFRLRFTWSNDKDWEYAYFFWVKVFALTFALGVVSGITMSFQFGTNWPGFMERVGNIAGPLLGYEVLTAFFLEASFLGIMLYGKKLVSNRVHLASAVLVAIGTTMSAFWIISLNSWMHTPAGYSIRDGVFFVDNWLEVIFNPSFKYRFIHTVLASLITAAFFVSGISAWRTRGAVDGPATFKVLRTGIFLAALLTPIQILVGDMHGLTALENQPAKVAAVEGIWRTEKGAALTLFGFPDEANRETRMAIKIPKLASLILTHDPDGELKGLEEFEEAHPPVSAVFWSFRVMVSVGILMFALSWWGSYLLLRHQVSDQFLRALSWMTFSGWIATLSGWYVAEIGRQPWIVQGLIRASEVVADHPPEMVLGTVIGYVLLYVFLVISYILALRHLASKPARSLIEKFDFSVSSLGSGKTAEGF